MSCKSVCKDIFYIKYGELVLKGKNRVDFINTLYRNLNNSFYDVKNLFIEKHFDNMTIFFDKKNKNKILNILLRTPGISQVIEAYQLNTNNMYKICQIIKKKINHLKLKKYSFKVFVKRHDKSFPINSLDIAKKIGASILEEYSNLTVSLKKPDIKIFVEVKSDKSIIYFEKLCGVGGFPIGTNGRVLLLISGGIDSPIAANLLIKKGFHVDFLTFLTPPHTSENVLKKVNSLINAISLNEKIQRSKLFVCNFSYILHELSHMSNTSYKITIMRRYFYKIAEYLKEKYKYDAIATGESVGQVASQTIQSMICISSVLKPSTVILRPLLTFDKNEIIRISKLISTYDISILPYSDCCTLFVPKNPATKPSIFVAEKIEKSLNLISDVYKLTITKHINVYNSFAIKKACKFKF